MSEEEELVINEKCDVQGHEFYDVVALCLYEDCKAPKRLCCSKCLVFSHGDHTNACIFLEDIKNPKKLALKAWSKDNLGKQVEQYLKENENIEEEIDKMMEKLLDEIAVETSKAKNIMRKKRIEGKTEVQKTAKQIQAKYEAAYDVKNIKNLLVDYMDDKITEENLNEKLEEVIKAREEIEELNRKNKLIANYPVIDKEFLQEKQEQLLDLISNLSTQIKIPNQWQFIKAKTGNYHQILEIEPGKIFEFSELQNLQILYGTEIMKDGVHSWIIKVEFNKPKEAEKEEEKKIEEEKKEQRNLDDVQPVADNFGFGVQNQAYLQNHDYQQYLKNFYIGIVNDKRKDFQQSYSKVGIGQQGQEVHSLDIIRNEVLGGYLYYNGIAPKQMGVLFNEKKAVGLEVHVTLDLEVNKLTVKDKDNETQYDANLGQQFKGIGWRPYICSFRSKLRAQLVSSLNVQPSQAQAQNK